MMIKRIKSLLRKILINPLKNWESSIHFKITLKRVQQNHKKALKSLRGNEKIKVVFHLIHESIWKYDGLYKLMDKDERFEPVIVICPYIIEGDQIMIREMNQAYNSFLDKGYNVLKTLKDDGSWLDVKNEIVPDIVFFTNPWKLTKDIYYITNYPDTLTCYVPYFYMVTKHLKENYGGLLQNLTWKVFYESNVHLGFAKKYSKNSASNIVISGYPGLDSFLFNQKIKFDPWKIRDKKIKRVIWAPHHTIPGQDSGLGFSNFLLYSDFFIELVSKKYLDVQIAFKPHPLLKQKLYKDPAWGIKKTDSYYSFWENCDRGILVNGDYVDLFLTSDAMIHDCPSFAIEYLATKKPTLYLLNSSKQLESLNFLGKEAVDCHYKATNLQEIYLFLKNVVILENDSKKHERIAFLENNLIPPNMQSASENIYQYLKSALNYFS